MRITYIYSVVIKNKGYALGLAFGGHGVSWVSRWWLQDLLPHEDLLLVFLNDLLKLAIVCGHYLHQLVLYMHAMMMQHLAFRQQQLLKQEYTYQATKLALMTKILS